MEKLKTLLKQIYGIEDNVRNKLEFKEINSCRTVGSNFEIIINSQTKYFFKTIQFSKGEMLKNLRVSTLMQDNNIDVVVPVKTLKGNLYGSTENGVVCLLYDFIKGVNYSNIEISKKEKALIAMARNLAKLHIVGSNILDVKIPKIKKTRTQEIFNPAKLKKKDFILQFKDRSKKLLEKIQNDPINDIIHDKNRQILAMKEYFIDNNLYKLTQKDLNSNQAILHGDYHENNIIFDENGELLKIIDWDNCVKFNYTWEIFNAIYCCCYQRNFANIDNNLDLLFIKSYREINPIGAKDLEIGYKLWLNSIIYTLWFLESYYVENAYRCPNYILTNFDNLTFLMNNQNFFQQRFVNNSYENC